MSLWRALPETLRGMSIVDTLDILVVAAFLYVGFLWLKYTRASRVAQGIMLLALLYIFASQVGMVLTTSIFRGFFTVLLLTLIVIFQEDLKRFFERITIWRWRSSGSPLRREVIEPLIRSLMLFSQEKIGALIVLKGTDPLDRHMDGGHALRGELCSPLLESLFDPHSDGHDGAVVIDGNRVTHFGVHLPLSRNLDQLSGHGTRHAAALGLSEMTDCLCLVISEQKGTISAARNGILLTIPNRKALETRIAAYLDTKSRAPHRRGWLDLFTKNLIGKVGALMTAFGLWLVFVQGFKPVEQTVMAIVRYDDLPSHLRVRSITPREVSIKVAGLKRDFTHLRTLKILVGLQDAEVGTLHVPITDEDVELPGPLRVISIEPPTVEFTVTPSLGNVFSETVTRTTPTEKPHRRWFQLR